MVWHSRAEARVSIISLYPLMPVAHVAKQLFECLYMHSLYVVMATCNDGLISLDNSVPNKCSSAKLLCAGVSTAWHVQRMLFSGFQMAGHGEYPPQRTPAGHIFALAASCICLQNVNCPLVSILHIFSLFDMLYLIFFNSCYHFLRNTFFWAKTLTLDASV